MKKEIETCELIIASNGILNCYTGFNGSRCPILKKCEADNFLNEDETCLEYAKRQLKILKEKNNDRN